jgi:nicotinate phosphoribosyltransferase
MGSICLRHPTDHTKHRILAAGEVSEVESLLVDVLKDGKLVYDLPDIEAIRQQRIADVDRLDTGVRRIMNPHIYHVSLTQSLWDLKQQLIEAAINNSNTENAHDQVA